MLLPPYYLHRHSLKCYSCYQYCICHAKKAPLEIMKSSTFYELVVLIDLIQDYSYESSSHILYSLDHFICIYLVGGHLKNVRFTFEK